MSGIVQSHAAVWVIAALAIVGVLTRPFKLHEACFAVGGAVVLCLTGLVSWSDGLVAVGKGGDVYLFLAGMMIASELARTEGLFDYLAALAARKAAGSASRLFFLVYCVGTAVTILMSNDATAVVLTPAVLAVAHAVKSDKPLPYLYICAFVANAASFVLPISNPANLVIFQHGMPPLLNWLARFALPSALSIVVTYAVLRWSQRAALRAPIDADIDVPPLSATGRWTGWGIGLMAVVMVVASALDVPLGWPTFLAGVAVFIGISLQKRSFLVAPLKDISWGVLPLVAGLFVLVEGLQRTGVIDLVAHWLQALPQHAVQHAMLDGGWVAGIAVAVLSNLINNLPAGLIAGSAVAAAPLPDHLTNAILIGVDLGPNLSVTGSLATILWLTALRRDNIRLSAASFLKLGALVMFPALFAALAGLQLMSVLQAM